MASGMIKPEGFLTKTTSGLRAETSFLNGVWHMANGNVFGEIAMPLLYAISYMPGPIK
jgi:hypothetical protein